MEKKGQIRERATVYDLGEIVEVDVGACRRVGKGRRGKWRKTTETQKRINRQARKRFFRRKMMLNFGHEGRIAVLTYDDDHLPDSTETVERDVRNWVRSCRRLYRKAGHDFKAMWAFEYGEETGRTHIHVIFNQERDIFVGDVLGRWRKSHNHYSAGAEWSEAGLEEIANYMMKQEAFRHAYGCTRNLKNPEPLPDEERLVHQMNRVFTRQQCEDIAAGNLTRAELNAMFPGFVKVLEGMQIHYNVYSRTYTIHMRLLRSYDPLPAWVRTREFEEAEAMYEAAVREKEEPLVNAVFRGYVDTETGEVTEEVI